MSDTIVTPHPDPTLLTTAQLNAGLLGLRELIETRLDGMDRATELLHQNITVVPTEIDRQVGHLTALSEEKFASIQKQFDERDVRARAAELAQKEAAAAQNSAASIAVTAALQAQKEAAAAQNDANAAAITKSEAATNKTIDGILQLLTSNTKAIDDKFAIINERLNRNEGSVRGGSDQRNEARQGQMAWVAVGSLVFAVISGLVGFNLSHFVIAQPPVPYAPYYPQPAQQLVPPQK
jgi:hypothetical protein